MVIKSSVAGENAVVNITGRLDTNSFAQLEKEFQNVIMQGAQKITADLAGLTYVSSAGLRIFLAVQKRLKPRGGSLTLANLNDTVSEIMTITGFASIFQII